MTKAPEAALHSLLEGMINAKIDYLKSVLDRRLRWVHGSGSLDTREDILTRLASCEQIYSRLQASELDVQTSSDFAIVSGVIDIETTRRGSIATAHSRFLTVWDMRGAAPSLLVWQATRIAS